MKIPALSKSTWIGLVAAAVVGGSATAVLINGNLTNPPTGSLPSPTSINQVAQTAPDRAVDGELSVYWIESDKNKLIAIPIAVKAKNSGEAIATAINALITDTPPAETLYSAIPENTKVLDINTIGKDIRLNLSSEFTKGGGSASMQGRIIQVLYTVTSLEPEAKVYLSIDGKPLKYIGGEGLEVPQPMTRRDFALEF
ncbi:MAG: hypothetical protein AUK48_15650 [Oscillatoriales cyanobacterium CG2_30_44_21]|nr:MAG: hypothetical protein AUK48_15650 [Oscillatoriales cyanobacterium CG2_30_44_21]